MSKITRVAKTLYNACCGVEVGDQEFLECMLLLAYGRIPREQSDALVALKLDVIAMLQKQKRNKEIKKKWSVIFSADSALDKQQATQFIREVMGSIEKAHGLLDYPIVGGTTIMKQGTFSDYPVCRPYTKTGWTLHFTTVGSGEYNCIRQRIESKPGDLMLFSPNSHFECQRNPSSKRWKHHWIMFQPLSQWLPWLRWSEVGPGIYHLSGDSEQEKSRLLWLFNEVLGMSNDSVPLSSNLRGNLLEEILIRCRQSLPPEQQTLVDVRIQNAMTYIETNLSTMTNVDEVADKVGLSPSRLSALFKQHTGISVIKWRDELRISQACNLLAYSSESIAVIAESLGYSDPIYFARCFRKRIGWSPSQYRNLDYNSD